MKVRDLIEQLQKYNPDLDVLCEYGVSEEPLADTVEFITFAPTWVHQYEKATYILIRE